MARAMLSVLAMAAASSHCMSVSAAGRGDIYPSDHWSYVTRLSTDNFDDEVKRVVDSGKTLMSGGWNFATSLYRNTSDLVEFGDVNLSEAQVRESHGVGQSPGAGGWPTIRYFNKETGYGGAPYAKKHEGMAMCDELKDYGRMIDYIVDVSAAYPCMVTDQSGCSDKEIEFITKATEKGDFQGQLTSLQGKMQGKMKGDLVEWFHRRELILEQLVAPTGKEEL